MQIYLMRHGIAAQSAAETPADEDRALTAKGKKRTRKAVRGLKTLKPNIEKLLSSPLARARQTADIVAEILRLKSSVEEIPELGPEGDLKKLLARLEGYTDCQGVLLVGHQPHLGNFGSMLLCATNALQLKFKKSGLCCVAADTLPFAGNCALHWLLTPKQLRRLAGR